MYTNLYVLCGIPASGKTTLARGLAEATNSKLYCFDDISGFNNPSKSKQLKQQMYNDVYNDLLAGNSIVIDDLHTQKEWRENLLFIVKDINCKKILIIMDTSLNECLSRNKKRKNRLPDFVIKLLHQRYESPSTEEGWDEIIWR